MFPDLVDHELLVRLKIVPTRHWIMPVLILLGVTWSRCCPRKTTGSEWPQAVWVDDSTATASGGEIIATSVYHVRGVCAVRTSLSCRTWAHRVEQQRRRRSLVVACRVRIEVQAAGIGRHAFIVLRP